MEIELKENEVVVIYGNAEEAYVTGKRAHTIMSFVNLDDALEYFKDADMAHFVLVLERGEGFITRNITKSFNDQIYPPKVFMNVQSLDDDGEEVL